MSGKSFDVIIIGSGSVGLPAACSLADDSLSVLVIDKASSPGQGAQKAAIGGVRATHSHAAKIRACLKSINILSNWQNKYGDDIGWNTGGYLFPAYNGIQESSFKELLRIQHSHGLNINWIDADEVKQRVPGIKSKDLRGGTFSPEDGSASPLLATEAYFRLARSRGVQFLWNEKVTAIEKNGDKITGVKTESGEEFSCGILINAAGADAAEVAALAEMKVAVIPDSHEAGITEPVKPFFDTMVVDSRPGPGSMNFYFYQREEGQIVFCLTPDPLLPGMDKRSTSDYLPMASRRMIDIIPRMRNIKVRRIWRGLYPMTPDGAPLVGRNRDMPNFIVAVGMCGQGFMLGPGIGEYISRLVNNRPVPGDDDIAAGFDPYREFDKSGGELLK